MKRKGSTAHSVVSPTFYLSCGAVKHNIKYSLDGATHQLTDVYSESLFCFVFVSYLMVTVSAASQMCTQWMQSKNIMEQHDLCGESRITCAVCVSV